ncbi:amino acid ABC transporter substrate-binding protein [Lachnospiraceae bacterium MD1]|uniref:Amino acid ABC transporter substrate-binding protein n=1 Tax=Variimorphobacter saccharofermentans TaxID=2755051 RepID=A0A839JYW7_9FIRM|nr:amino acid ABC transporter substrate-binding protein [Variimorphobacter saccharofermentans]MBB2182873.1 amino acid ABC transporter substrate-binding protein [Variimorphobacter saccharofermentans]
MKKLFSLIMVTLMIISLTACQKSTGSDESLKYIQDNGKLILGLDDSFPPMGFRDDADNIVGFDVDLAQAVCDKLGVELVLQPIEWDAKEQELNTKNIDCIWNGFSVTPDRLEKLTMSKPYMLNNITLVVTKNSDITKFDDMAGKRLAVQSGSSAEETLNSEENKDFKDSLGQVNPFSDYVTALMDLETGNSDAVLMDSVVANYMITEAGKDFVVLDETLLKDEYAIGFRKGDTALCEAVEKALKELKADGTVEKLAVKWFGSDITTIE